MGKAWLETEQARMLGQLGRSGDISWTNEEF